MKIGFIGGGNMAQALIAGIGAQRPETDFIVIEPYAPTRATLARIAARAVLHDAPCADLDGCDAVVVAVKPQMFRAAVEPAARWLTSTLVISIAAGIRTREIAKWLSGSRAIVRAMPNTPALIGAGMTGLCAAQAVDARDRSLAEALLSSVGQTLWVADEAMLDVVTAVSGSGPAYVFSFIEALAEGAVELGMSPEDARRLAVATFVGASRLAAASDEPIGTLRERVTSKGGTTHAALMHMQQARCGETIIEAIHKAARRSIELGDEFGKTA
jgi:pyrroline-5-carboxylate reductase